MTIIKKTTLNHWRTKTAFVIICLFFLQPTWAMSFFHNENTLVVEKVSSTVFALVGKRGPMTEKDLGTNATFGFIIYDKGVVLIDPGASYLGAERIQKKIAKVTDKEITHVINTGSEDHRWLGNAYFKEAGAQIIASNAAVLNQKKRANDLLTRLSFLLKEKGTKGTDPTYADIKFDATKTITLGKLKIELLQIGPAYSLGDTLVWLPDQKILFSGDVVSVERLPAIGSSSDTSRWLSVFETIKNLKPKTIIPGHGSVTNLLNAEKGTKNYIVDLRKGVQKLIDDGGGLDEVSKIDQSKYKEVTGYDMLSGRNAHQVYQELEWE